MEKEDELILNEVIKLFNGVGVSINKEELKEFIDVCESDGDE